MDYEGMEKWIAGGLFPSHNCFLLVPTAPTALLKHPMPLPSISDEAHSSDGEFH